MRSFYLVVFLVLASRAEAQNVSPLAVGDSLYAVGNYSEAIANYEQIKNKEESVYLKLARAHQAKGTLDDALANYEQAATSTDEVIAMNEYGKLLITKRKFKEADSIFTQLIDVYKTNPDFYYQRGRANENRPRNINIKSADSVLEKQLDKFHPHIEDYKKAVALDSTHQKALGELAVYYLKQKEYGMVEKLAFKALESYPTNVEIISTLAQSYYHKGWNEEGIEWFEKLLELGQDTQFIREKLGNLYYKKRRYEDAIAQYLGALEFSPEDDYVHATLAKLYNFVEDVKAAETHGLLAILYKDQPLGDEYYTLSRTYEMKKDWKNAMKYVNRSLEEDPDNKKAEYTKVVIADNYYEDRRTVLKLYKDFIKKYEDGKYAKYDPTLRLARERRDKLNREIFMADGEEEK
ncbi:tetratricopeptide repeat protein [Leeuwenhoekiella marinoflava]|uniref:Tetratricopeptide repeat protein n=2 Tax=Leeuwenhoekiella marinoflava TaxID=988 RepID=A0A4Q0PNK6_9FLAO|nr:tetratricopeptide repeat protein [Leeuwenhoekiella marinoflava]RXG31692.1 tetratricopeptide repeat protein [Leeuwenhoekiella marinoflava]SHF08477.1 Tetratricopeptide repeat-containing protein [Leeuwenhoekiella marinoflava DSM 3653]